VPSASLLKLNRNTLSNILVVGGAPTERAAIAGALHRDSRLRAHPFCVTAAGRGEDPLRRALFCWLGHDTSDPPLACECGTLFVDDLCALPADIQRLLLELAGRLDGLPAEARTGPGPSRLAGGSREEPLGAVAAGRLLAALHDSLDKMTIRLPRSGLEPRARGRSAGQGHASAS
jgi:DNA-binding NtrC family response regulator